VAFVPYLSRAEQRRRIIELVAQEKGVKCPELVVEHTEPQFGAGAGRVEYRRSKDAPVELLDLTVEQARYVGINIEPREPEEADGEHPRL
jgi:hypothetical protein